MSDVKVALITAGGSGMGADSARALAADGFKVGILSSSGKGEALAKELGVDTLDCSGGGAVPEARGAIGNRTAEQPDMAGVIRKATGLPVMAVGAITDPAQTDDLVRSSKADIVLLGREMMRDPHWAFNAAKKLGVDARHVLAEQYGFFVGAS